MDVRISTLTVRHTRAYARTMQMNRRMRVHKHAQQNERTNTLARTHTLAHTHIHEHEHEHEHLRSYTYGRTRVQACMHARTPDRLPCWLAFCAWNQHTPYTIIYLGLGFRISYVQDMNNLFNDFVLYCQYQISQNTILSVELKKRASWTL